MHKHLIQHATESQIRDFAKDALSMIKGTNPELYESLEMHLYTEMYGCHFSDWLLKKATEHMQNEDGTTGPHWTVEQTTQVGKINGVTFTRFNEYDWNYVMNMIYSDFYGVVSNDANLYAKMAKKFIEDKDAPEGKAFKYYMSMHK